MKNEVKYIHETDVHNLTAPKKVVPLLIDMFNPKSVLDVGCGIGTWLSVFKENGVEDVNGVDGSYVNKEMLYSHIQPHEFIALDISLPFNLGRKYDLLTCLEVAEHLEETSAITFVENLSKHSSTIVFGAATPSQGGQNHLNEQWPEYWAGIFKTFGYDCYDILRNRIWDDKDVEWWYKQNVFLFCNRPLQNFTPSKSFLSIIHPKHFYQKINYIDELNQKLIELKSKVERWENGQVPLRHGLVSLLKSLRNKIIHRK